MEPKQNLCMGCMRDNAGEHICPLCGYRDDTPQQAPFLQTRFSLADRYIVGKVLSQNGEGISYLGYDTTLSSAVTIREFFPLSLVNRDRDGANVDVIGGCEATYADLKTAFLEYSRALARMRDLSAVIPVYDIFEANNTAYTISENVTGVTLEEYLQQNGGSISWEQARGLFMPALSSLSSLHAAGVMHLGLCPQNMIVTRDGKLKIKGFGIAAARISRSDLQAELYAGYSAQEQYGFEGQQGEWTDVYGFSACLYTALTGQALQAANLRSVNEKLVLPSGVVIPTYVVKALEKALHVSIEDRIRTFDQLRAEISFAPSINVTIPIDIEKEEKKPKKKSLSYGLIAMGIVGAVLVIVIAVIIFFLFGDKIFHKDSVSSMGPSSMMVSSTISPDDPQSAVMTGYVAPKLVGRDYDSLKGDGTLDYCKVELKDYAFDDVVKEGVIISQEPASDSIINRGDTISVIVSRGPKMRSIPNLKGLTEDQAREALEDAGLRLGTVTERFDPTVAEGLVLDTEQPNTTKYEYNTKIDIYISGLKPDSSAPSGTTTNPGSSSRAAE